MKKYLLVVLTVFVLSACNTPATTPPIPTNTSIPIPTETSIPPTATLEPSPTPTPIPIGGGGEIFMKVNQHLIPIEFDSSKKFGWFSASSDGSNLTQLSSEITDIYSISPDGKRILANINDTIALINSDGTGAIKLDTAPDIYVSSSYGFVNNNYIPDMKSVLWLPNGDLVFLASEKPYEAKRSIYAVNQNGNQLRKLEQPSSQIGNFASLLFVSPDANDVYWVTGSQCNDRSICNEKYFATKLDDSDQQQIWREIKNASDYIYLSPSGQYIAYGSFVNGVKSKTGCYLATLAGETLSKVEANGYFPFCFDNPWSPTDDKLLFSSWVGEGENMRIEYNIWTLPDGSLQTFSEFNATDCHYFEWTPDGNSIFLAVCVDQPFTRGAMSGTLKTTLGQRLIDIRTGTVTEYPDDKGFCEYALSPNSEWALLYWCTNNENVTISPSVLLNLKTKETYPVFEQFISDDKNDWWKVYLWTP